MSPTVWSPETNSGYTAFTLCSRVCSWYLPKRDYSKQQAMSCLLFGWQRRGRLIPKPGELTWNYPPRQSNPGLYTQEDEEWPARMRQSQTHHGMISTPVLLFFLMWLPSAFPHPHIISLLEICGAVFQKVWLILLGHVPCWFLEIWCTLLTPRFIRHGEYICFKS